MARRFATRVNITMTADATADGGGPLRTLAHGLGAKPDEVSLVPMTSASYIYLKTMNTTSLVVTGKSINNAGAAAAKGMSRVFAWINHSIVK